MNGRLPSNIRHAPHEPIQRQWDRLDTYVEPRPLDWHELLEPRVVIAGLILFVALIAFCVFMYAVVQGPT